MRTRLTENPAVMKKRGQLVEHPFGTLKQAMDQRYLLLRGKKKVSMEIAMSVMAYNMKRVLNIVGVPKLLEVLKNAGIHANISKMLSFVLRSPWAHQTTLRSGVAVVNLAIQF